MVLSLCILFCQHCVSKSNETDIEDQGQDLNYHQEYISVTGGVQSASLCRIISLTDTQFFHFNVQSLFQCTFDHEEA